VERPLIVHVVHRFSVGGLENGVVNLVATRVGANADLMIEGLTGCLVPRASSAALAEAILDYFTDVAAHSSAPHGTTKG